MGDRTALETVLRLLEALRDRHAAEPQIRRLRDLPEEAVRAALTGLTPLAAPAPRTPERVVGPFVQADAVIVNLPFGRIDAARLARLAEAAAASGTAEIRFSPWRGLACLGLSSAAGETLLREAAALGLIAGSDDPRLLVSACAGSPACSRGEAPSMADAARLAQAAAELLRAGVTLHVSGCTKSCAHPGESDLTLVGSGGRYGVVIGGTARDPALAELDLGEIIARLQPGQDIHARLARAGRLSGPRQ